MALALPLRRGGAWAATRVGPLGVPLSRGYQSGPLRGFQRHEYGLEWFSSKQALLQASPGSVLVGTSYEFEPRGSFSGPRQARKYASFESHWDYWDCLALHESEGRMHNLQEVLPMSSPRCLYFDLDGLPDYRASHVDILNWLGDFVRWAFCGDRLGWEVGHPEPVALASSDPTKYSCHVIFPQIQFASHEEQRAYMAILLNALPALKVELEDGQSVPILERVVDRVPYSQFQLFRGPYACKISAGRFRPETALEPEGLFRGDPLACFAGRADRDYALDLLPAARLLEWNEELRYYHERQMNLIAAVEDRPWEASPQDVHLLYQGCFQRPSSGLVDLGGLPDVDRFEVALSHLHPDRALQWWSWFRISGVTSTMLQRHADNAEARRRIWRAHMAWSARYPHFDEAENVEVVQKAEGRRVSGLGLLEKLVRFDNPNAEVIWCKW